LLTQNATCDESGDKRRINAMTRLRTTAKTFNRWYAKGFRPVVVNGQKHYMPPFRKALKAAGIEYHISYQGTGADRKCSIYVKREDQERANKVCVGLPRDWYAAMKRKGG